MKRINKIIKADAILTADWHLRDNVPLCRIDDFEKEQWKKLDFISNLQKQHNCPVFHSGDLFNHWKPSPYLLSKTIKHLPKKFHTVLGNHDLPQHNLDLSYKCGINVLKESSTLNVLTTGNWGQKIDKDYSILLSGKKILVLHTMVYKTKNVYHDNTIPSAVSLLKKYPQFDLIVTGDNHTPFTQYYKRRLLVNPGCLTRQTVKELNHKPRVYLYYAKENKVEKIYIPITPSEQVISIEHIEIKQERENKMNAFISGLNDDYKVETSFINNLRSFEQKNKIRKPVINLVYKAIDN